MLNVIAFEERKFHFPFQQPASLLPALISYKGNKRLIWDLGSGERAGLSLPVDKLRGDEGGQRRRLVGPSAHNTVPGGQ